MSNLVILLLVVYQIKHFLADYPLQGEFMLGKFKAFPKFILPLTAHALVHGMFTYVIVFFVKPELALTLAIADSVIHFTVDRIKASPKLLGRFKALSGTEYLALDKEYKSLPKDWDQSRKAMDVQFKNNKFFWWALGADQMAHHLTHYAIIYIILK